MDEGGEGASERLYRQRLAVALEIADLRELGIVAQDGPASRSIPTANLSGPRTAARFFCLAVFVMS